MRTSTLDDEARWRQVEARDHTVDGQFYYSVKTTGVYCRPSCAARLARRENVGFHASMRRCRTAGFRPCKRCKPDQQSMADEQCAKVVAVCRLIETADETPHLGELAAWVGLSRYHFHRVFKSVTGVTPKAYADAHRINRVQAQLKHSGSVTEAIYDAGYNSSGRFYAKSNGVLGMAPGKFRAGGGDADYPFCGGGMLAWIVSDCGDRQGRLRNPAGG